MTRIHLRKRKILKQFTSRASDVRNFAGEEKTGAHKPRPVTLPTLESARLITKAKER